MQTKSTKMQILHYQMTNQKCQRHLGAILHQKLGVGVLLLQRKSPNPGAPGDTPKSRPMVQGQADTAGQAQVMVALILQQGTSRTYPKKQGGRNPRRMVEWGPARPEPLNPKPPPLLVQHQWIMEQTQDVKVPC